MTHMSYFCYQTNRDIYFSTKLLCDVLINASCVCVHWCVGGWQTSYCHAVWRITNEQSEPCRADWKQESCCICFARSIHTRLHEGQTFIYYLLMCYMLLLCQSLFSYLQRIFIYMRNCCLEWIHSIVMRKLGVSVSWAQL